MTSTMEDADPRRERAGDDLTLARDDSQPVVGRAPGGASPFLIIAVFAVLAIGLFLVLNARRRHHEASPLTPAASAQLASSVAYDPPPLDITPRPPVAPPVPLMVAPPPAPTPPPVVRPAAPMPPLTPQTDPAQRRRAPSVVVDLQSANGRAVALSAMAAGSPASALAAAQTAAGTGSPAAQLNPAAAAGAALPLAAGQTAGLGTYDQFAARASEAPPAPAVATELGNLSAIITQGAMIPGVLETAIDSDLPGYARAVVSRDVRSFDGKAVLIPRGSRLIGQYRSAVALGQSRVFVIWTRVIRPDGVSVQIGSPGADALGRGGVGGEVNTHFFSRFGGSILLSVLNAGIAAIGQTPSTQITIGSPAAAAGAAASASINTGDNIGPTIKIAQGQSINIFVSRDLDFSGVKAVK